MAERNPEEPPLAETEPHPAPIFDTGPHPAPLPQARATAGSTPPMVVAGRYHFLKWWTLLLVFAAVWIPAGGVGLGLFAWWYSLADKTPAVFVAFGYAVACTVVGVLLAMVDGRPWVAALALAVTSAVCASALGAAPLYGHYYCQVKSPCLAGIIPY